MVTILILLQASFLWRYPMKVQTLQWVLLLAMGHTLLPDTRETRESLFW